MRKLIITLSAALFITALSPALYARGGFTLGIFGAYSIDPGVIEQTVREKTFFSMKTPMGSVLDYDTVVIPGSGLFAGYIFGNGLSIRAGGEFYDMVSGSEMSYYDDTTDMNFEIDYTATAFPVLLGLTISPDKGKTNIYGYAGIVFSMIDVYQKQENYNKTTSLYYNYESDHGTFVPGFAALFGIEKRMFAGLYIMLEYAFYKCDTARKQSMEFETNDAAGINDNAEFTEKFGLPRQQVRIGLRYGF